MTAYASVISNCMNPIVISVFAVVVIEIIYITTKILMRRKFISELKQCSQNNDIVSFEILISKNIVRFFVEPYESLNIKIQILANKKEQNEVEKVYDHILLLNLNDAKRRETLINAFDHFFSLRIFDKCTKYLEIIESRYDDDKTKELRLMLDVFTNVRGLDVNDLIKKIESSTMYSKSMYAYLTSVYYKNNNNIGLSEHYERKSIEHLFEAEKKVLSEGKFDENIS